MAVHAIIQVLEFGGHDPATLDMNDAQVRNNITKIITSVMSQDSATRANNIQMYQLRTEDETSEEHIEFLYQEWSNRHDYFYQDFEGPPGLKSAYAEISPPERKITTMDSAKTSSSRTKSVC